MFEFFSKRNSNSKSYKTSMILMRQAIKKIEDLPEVTRFGYDEGRNEGFAEGKSFFVTFEIHNLMDSIEVDLTTTCSMPFFTPRKTSNNFLAVIDKNI